MSSRVEDYYARLGVPRTAGVAELRRAYRLLALRCHPDRAGPASTELFQRISEAYRVLSDAGARAAYDGRLRDQAGSPVHRPFAAARSNGHGEGEYSGPGGRITWRSHNLDRRIPRLSGPLDDLLARAVARRCLDGSIELLLEAAEAAAGGVAAIEAPLSTTCPTCAGVARLNQVWCRRCQYAGQVVDEVVILVDIPARAADGALLAFHTDPGGTHPPLRVRLRVA
jgi:molecular chaperone DnaJ